MVATTGGTGVASPVGLDIGVRCRTGGGFNNVGVAGFSGVPMGTHLFFCGTRCKGTVSLSHTRQKKRGTLTLQPKPAWW